MSLSVIDKFNMEDAMYKTILLKIVNYYRHKKQLLINLENGLKGFSVLDNHIIQYEEKDLNRYKDPKQFRKLIFRESLRTALYHFIKNQMEKNDAKNKLTNTKYRLTEKNCLNKTIKMITDFEFELFGKNEEEVMKNAYEHYNKNYTEKIDISKKRLFDDIKAINIYALYLNINMSWNEDDIDELMENTPDNNMNIINV